MRCELILSKRLMSHYFHPLYIWVITHTTLNCGLSSSHNQSKALEQMTKAGQSFIMTTGSSALTNLVTRLHYPSHTITQSSSKFFCSNFNQVGICIFAGMDSIMLAWPTIAEEQDEVLGLMVPRAEFQRSIQCCPGLSIPIGWFPLKFMQCCAGKHRHMENEICV